MKFYFGDLLPYIGEMFAGLGLNVLLALVSMVIGALGGILLYLGKTGKHRTVSLVCRAYIEVMRNTPLLVQLYLIYFGLAQFGIDISALASTLIAMIFNNAAYTAEIFRAGFLSVPHGQIEAGQALGMHPAQVFTLVELKPALKSAFPALINQYIMLFLFSSVASIIALPELTYVAMNTSSMTARTFEVYLVTGAMYYIACVAMIAGLRLFEKKAFCW